MSSVCDDLLRVWEERGAVHIARALVRALFEVAWPQSDVMSSAGGIVGEVTLVWLKIWMIH